MTEDSFEHDSAAALLPWFANGTLQGEERDRVERHVRACLPCRAELAEQTRLRTLVQRQPVVHLSADAGFERLRGRLDRPSTRRTGSPRRAVWALAAAVAIAGVGWSIAAGLIGPEPSTEPRFGTLSDDANGGGEPGFGTLSDRANGGENRALSDAADGRENRALSDVADDGALIDVIFADGVRESQMRELLEALDAEIVAGPSRGLGRYTLRVPPRSGAPPEVDAVVRRLLDDERIRFAGPTFSLPVSAPGARENTLDSPRENGAESAPESAASGVPSHAPERAERDR